VFLPSSGYLLENEEMKDRMQRILSKKILPATRSLSFRLYFLLFILLIISFTGIMYFNVTYHTSHVNDSVINSAIQASDLIKRSARYSMLKNDRENLSNIITTVGQEKGMEGIRIYNKPGEIVPIIWGVDTIVDKKTEQCYV
jgi:histidine kinase